MCTTRRECSFSSETMEQNTGSFRRNRTQPSEHSTCTDKENQSKEKDMGTSVYVNHAAIAWQESRRKWVGDPSRRPKRKAKDPIIRHRKNKKMDKFKSVLKPKANPQEQLRGWQRRLRQECRNIERQIRDVQREEKSVHKAIREAAKRNDMGSAKALAKEIVMSRKAVNRLYENKAQLNSISMHLGESVAISRTVGHLSKSAEVMKLVNNLMKAPEVAATMQEFSKEMTKAGVIEEFVNDAVDTALDSEDIEEETEEEVDKVLTEIAGETAAQLPEAVRKERTKLPAQRASTSQEEEAIAEGADDEEELEELRARLAKVRS